MAGLLSNGAQRTAQQSQGLLSGGPQPAMVNPAGYWNQVGAWLPFGPGGGIAGNPMSAPPDRSGEPALLELMAGTLPVVGDAMSAYDLGQHGGEAYLRARQGDYGGAARLIPGAALSAFGLLPFAGGLARSLARKTSGPARRAGLASRSAELVDPPAVPQRPFAADYPAGAPSDAAGNLTHTIDGDPIVARWVVGRKVVGGADVAFPQAELDALTEAATGKSAEVVPQGTLDDGSPVLGMTGYDAGQFRVRLDGGMLPEEAARVQAHELGHVFDSLTKSLLRDRVLRDETLQAEARHVYNTLNNPAVRQRGKVAYFGGDKPLPPGIVSPETRGYPPAEVDAELTAEAVRAYIVNPSYLKTIAPNLAEAIRRTVNASNVASILQLNSLGWAPFAAGGAVGAGLLSSEGQQ